MNKIEEIKRMLNELAGLLSEVHTERGLCDHCSVTFGHKKVSDMFNSLKLHVFYVGGQDLYFEKLLNYPTIAELKSRNAKFHADNQAKIEAMEW